MLREDEHIKLVIIETLDDLLKISDIKENTAAREAFEKFATELMIPFSSRASFLALHHIKRLKQSSRVMRCSVHLSFEAKPTPKSTSLKRVPMTSGD